jgi:hypothetical protein
MNRYTPRDPDENRSPMVVVLLVVCPLLWVVLGMLFVWSMNWFGLR